MTFDERKKAIEEAMRMLQEAIVAHELGTSGTGLITRTWAVIHVGMEGKPVCEDVAELMYELLVRIQGIEGSNSNLIGLAPIFAFMAETADDLAQAKQDALVSNPKAAVKLAQWLAGKPANWSNPIHRFLSHLADRASRASAIGDYVWDGIPETLAALEHV
ncbi:MAG: hypothetical protein JWM56_434 [Candidatus Peribacteria bacterium]|nr:hypothetical protein [Candidatus Peribacteria bacterium]